MSGHKKNDGPVGACLIANARSPRAQSVIEEALPVLIAQGWQVEVREKRAKGEAADLARQALEDGYDPIVNCGGDGTLNEIVDALAGSDVAVGTIPGGTANVWAREIGVSRRVRVAATQLASSNRVQVDIGCAELKGKRPRHFLMMAGLGADGAVMRNVSRSVKNRIGPLAVGVAAVKALPALKSVPVTIDLDGVVWRGSITQIVVGNTRLYGGFTEITPHAQLDNGMLDVCIFTTSGPLQTGRQLTSLVLRKQPSQASAELYRAARIVIDAPERLPMQLDGSAVHKKPHDGETRYIFSVMQHGLTVLVPRTHDGRQFERSPFVEDR